MQASLGFELGYNLNFLTIVVLYSGATSLYWIWFGRAERTQHRSAVHTLETP